MRNVEVDMAVQEAITHKAQETTGKGEWTIPLNK